MLTTLQNITKKKKIFCRTKKKNAEVIKGTCLDRKVTDFKVVEKFRFRLKISTGLTDICESVPIECARLILSRKDSAASIRIDAKCRNIRPFIDLLRSMILI